jgi:hypothetical protein
VPVTYLRMALWLVAVLVIALIAALAVAWAARRRGRRSNPLRTTGVVMLCIALGLGVLAPVFLVDMLPVLVVAILFVVASWIRRVPAA